MMDGDSLFYIIDTFTVVKQRDAAIFTVIRDDPIPYDCRSGEQQSQTVIHP